MRIYLPVYFISQSGIFDIFVHNLRLPIFAMTDYFKDVLYEMGFSLLDDDASFYAEIHCILTLDETLSKV